MLLVAPPFLVGTSCPMVVECKQKLLENPSSATITVEPLAAPPRRRLSSPLWETCRLCQASGHVARSQELGACVGRVPVGCVGATQCAALYGAARGVWVWATKAGMLRDML